MLSIGQFSKVCMVSVKTLHHYDRIGLIHPWEVDRSSGYRYYDESQIPRMLLIGRLKRYGFSLAEIRGLLSEGRERALFSKLKDQERELGRHISETSLILAELQQHLRDFERTGDIMSYQNNYTVALEETADRPILSSRQKMSVEDFGTYYGKLFEQVAREQIVTDRAVMAIYHDEEFSQECNDTETALGLAETSKDCATRILKGGLCAVTMHYGGYSGLPDAYGALVQWINENGYETADSPYEIYLKTQFDDLPADQWETKIFFPIRKSRG